MSQGVLAVAKLFDKKKKVQEVVNKIFLDLSNQTTDPFWIDICQKASRGKFPDGVAYKNQQLFYRRGKKSLVENLSESPEEAFLQFKDFLKTNLGIESELDIIENEDEEDEEEYNHPLLDREWKDIRKENDKKILLRYYIDRISEGKGLTKIQKIHSLANIQIGFTLGYIKSSDVEYCRGCIRNIQGLEFDETRGILTIKNRGEVKTSRTKSKASNDKTIFNYEKIWEKHLRKSRSG